MAWKLFGKDMTQEQLPAELRSILAQMQRERSAFEALTNGARDASQNLAQLTQPIADAQKLLIDLQARVKGLERVVPVLATLDQQTEEVARTQRRTETQLSQTSDEAEQLKADVEPGALDADRSREDGEYDRRGKDRPGDALPVIEAPVLSFDHGERLPETRACSDFSAFRG